MQLKQRILNLKYYKIIFYFEKLKKPPFPPLKPHYARKGAEILYRISEALILNSC